MSLIPQHLLVKIFTFPPITFLLENVLILKGETSDWPPVFKQHLVSNLKVRIKIFLTTTSSTVCTLNMSIKSSRALSSQLLNGLKKKPKKRDALVR